MDLKASTSGGTSEQSQRRPGGGGKLTPPSRQWLRGPDLELLHAAGHFRGLPLVDPSDTLCARPGTTRCVVWPLRRPDAHLVEMA